MDTMRLLKSSALLAHIPSIILCIFLSYSLASSARADCSTDVDAFNSLANAINVTQKSITADACQHPDLAQRELLPLYQRAIAAQQLVLGNGCPLAKLGATIEDLQRGMHNAKNRAYECQATTVQDSDSNAVPGVGNSFPKSASCSDITGTDSGPSTTDCSTANSAFAAAQKLQSRNPGAAREMYRKAADAYRRAGDVALANAILGEVQSLIASAASKPSGQSPAAAPPQLPPEEPCAGRMREAAGYITGAETIEKNDPSCAGLRQAAENYLTAGKIFFRDVKIGQGREDVESSCTIKLTDTMLQRGNALNDRVDRMKQEGKCEPGMRIPAPPTGAPRHAADDKDEQHKKECADILPKLTAHAPDPEWLKNQMARSHCKPDGTPMSLREALDYEMRKSSD